MTAEPLAHLSDAQLVEKFAELAHQAGEAVLDSEVSEANRAIRSLWAIEDVLRSRGREARQKLISLLDEKNRFVRYYAAKSLLGLVPERARAVIEWNAKNGFDAIAGDANGLLRAFDTGEYKPD
jgi:HEAT repeat protein